MAHCSQRDAKQQIINKNKRGIDELDGKILKFIAPSYPYIGIFIQPLYCKKLLYSYFDSSQIILIFKSGDKDNLSNYRPYSIVSLLSKPLEKHS